MKSQALFSLKDKTKKLKCPLLQFMFGAFRVKSFSVVSEPVSDSSFSSRMFLSISSVDLSE